MREPIRQRTTMRSPRVRLSTERDAGRGRWEEDRPQAKARDPYLLRVLVLPIAVDEESLESAHVDNLQTLLAEFGQEL